MIVALGKFAAQTLLRTLDPISRLRGRVFDYRGAKLIPTFHPAYLLRNPRAQARGLGRHEDGPRAPRRTADASSAHVRMRRASPFRSLDLDPLTYACPTASPIPPSARASLVPLGTRVVTGIVVDRRPSDARDRRSDASDPRTSRTVVDVLDAEPFVPAEVVELARWTAEYYAAASATRSPRPCRRARGSKRASRRITERGSAAAARARGAPRSLDG